MGIQMECLCTRGVHDAHAQPAPLCAGALQLGKRVKVSEGWEKGEGGCEVDMCSSHVKDVSENVILYYLFAFYHLEAAESVCQSVHAACKMATERKISV